MLAAPPPSALQAAIIAAANAQKSVHYVSVENAPGGKVTMIGDAARTLGVQRVTFTKSGRTGHVTVVVRDDIAYVNGDAFTLRNFMGLPTTLAKKAASRWFSLKPTSPAYSSVAAAVRLRSNISQLRMSGPLKRLPGTSVAGKRVVGLSGRALGPKGQVATERLYARSTKPPLPVRLTETEGTVAVAITYSRWNEKVVVPSTRGAVSLARIAGGGPI